MTRVADVYRPSLALLIDLYQITMAYGYWKLGRGERPAAFHLTFRKPPFGGRYSIASGLANAIDFIESFAYADDDLAYLGSLTGNDGSRLLDEEFLAYLSDLRWSVDVHAIPEGTAVFPHEPPVRRTSEAARGPQTCWRASSTACRMGQPIPESSGR
jgi:nicotinate phosphoribosyltransferase